MGIPVRELQERISSREFAEYWAAYQLDPWGPERADLGVGIVASTIANANRDPKRKPTPFTVEEFTPSFGIRAPDEEGEARDPEEMLRLVEELNQAFGGRDERVH